MDSMSPLPGQALFELNPRCRQMQEPNYVNLVVSMYVGAISLPPHSQLTFILCDTELIPGIRIIVLGMLVSYLPQHYRIMFRRTSEGISPYFVLLGTMSATSGFAAILTVEPSRQDIACCKSVEALECLGGLLGIAQLGIQWISFSLM